MPPDRTTSGASKSKPFKPVRPTSRTSNTNPSQGGPSITSQAKSNNPRAPPQAQPHTQTQARPRKQSAATSRPSNATSRTEPDDDNDIDAGVENDHGDGDDDDEGKRPGIPPQLLTRLLHEFFTDDAVRISKSADRAVGKYMETFVREAVARAAFERRNGEEVGGGFMEVEDLEKLAPQLVLDF